MQWYYVLVTGCNPYPTYKQQHHSNDSSLRSPRLRHPSCHYSYRRSQSLRARRSSPRLSLKIDFYLDTQPTIKLTVITLAIDSYLDSFNSTSTPTSISRPIPSLEKRQNAASSSVPLTFSFEPLDYCKFTV
jgi:hypothetical protein